MQKNKRITNRKLLDQHLEKYSVCEFCRNSFANECHHIQTKGSGGGDIKLNILSLCRDCHTMAHAGKIDRMNLLSIVSMRENVSIDEIEEILIKFRRGFK